MALRFNFSKNILNLTSVIMIDKEGSRLAPMKILFQNHFFSGGGGINQNIFWK
jgi:hypothetical protein